MMASLKSPREATNLVKSNMRVERSGQAPSQEISTHTIAAFLGTANQKVTWEEEIMNLRKPTNPEVVGFVHLLQRQGLATEMISHLLLCSVRMGSARAESPHLFCTVVTILLWLACLHLDTVIHSTKCCWRLIEALRCLNTFAVLHYRLSLAPRFLKMCHVSKFSGKRKHLFMASWKGGKSDRRSRSKRTGGIKAPSEIKAFEMGKGTGEVGRSIGWLRYDEGLQ